MAIPAFDIERHVSYAADPHALNEATSKYFHQLENINTRSMSH